ncbi:MAG TPA: hypothetical protein VGH54_17330 [Mycobacterium sp.]|jgi:hypothetical protein|uniref:hypothetical protein n=1 Tax=Mycobacterium sp. TaxID=1785 RepID=UPI002F427D22
MKVLATVACIVGAVAALVFAFQAAGDLYLTGFPDSHFTDYDKAVEVPKRILMWAEFGFVPLFLLLAVPRIGTRARAAGPVVALIALGLVMVVQLGGVPWYFDTHLGLDHGIGG